MIRPVGSAVHTRNLERASSARAAFLMSKREVTNEERCMERREERTKWRKRDVKVV
jgi:formate hydrogenlyase subunit 6/NADH:ubiquinone oxidoreductase subunit I